MGSGAAICLMGPTASGKSALAESLCQCFPAEIISVDSANVYTGMDIGTAKPSETVQKRIPHHLIDVRDPADPYSAADFRADAIRLVGEIRSRGAVPILVGGTMLYFKALKEGLAELPTANPEIRASIVAYAEANGWPAVHKRLSSVDPEAAARIHPNDPQRLQRALEVYELSGTNMTDWHKQHQEKAPFELVELALMPEDRSALHEKIAVRFDDMLEQGLVEEVRVLFERGDLNAGLPAIKSVGYRQVWAHLMGEIDYTEMRLKALAATRQLAKRQLTWLRSWQNHHILRTSDVGQALKMIRSTSILD